MASSSSLLLLVLNSLLAIILIASEQDIAVPAPQQTPKDQQLPDPFIEPMQIIPTTDNPTPDTNGIPQDGGDQVKNLHSTMRGNCPPIMIPVPGPPGPPGNPGVTGATGPAGMPGNHGNNGNNGMSGPVGPAGAKGAKGEQGLAGFPGVPGRQGEMGAAGPPGPPGHDATTGPRGVTGRPGNPGPAGSSGLPGERGPPGLPGKPGIAGSDGVCSCETQQQQYARKRTSAFSVARTSGLTATDGPVTITFQHVFTNEGNDFDINTGKFNCSIPGLYFFTINVYKSSTQNFPLVQLLRNDEHMVAVIDYGSSDTEDATSNSLILNLNVGDMVWLQLYDGRELYSSHYRFTTFSGFRIG